MPSYIEALGQGLGGQAASGLLGNVFGLMLEGHNDRRQLEQQKELGRLQLGFDKEMTDYSYMKQLQMWKDTNYKAQVEQMEEAGLNPALLYGMGGGGGSTTGGGAASSRGSEAPKGGGEMMGIMGMSMQNALMGAQIKNIQADTKKKEVEADKTAGIDTELAQEQKENLVLQQVISKYTGLEAERVYERIKKPNTGIEAKTWQDEMEARQGIAGTIYELWAEGKLKEKSLAEIESILLGNAKSREEIRAIYKNIELLEENIKGAKLDNIIKDLEAQLQTQTGIDKSSPGWLKILGRLFVGLMGGGR